MPDNQNQFVRNYIRPEIPLPFQTNAIVALLQMLDPTGKSPAQLEAEQRLRPLLLQYVFKNHPELLGQPQQDNGSEGRAIANRSSLEETLNSLAIKMQQAKQQNFGSFTPQGTMTTQLTPQQRVTQGFIDVNNPNSRF